jgi:hypothetical protein
LLAVFTFTAALPWWVFVGRFGVSVFQLVPIPIRSIERPVRLLAWCIGLFGWFAGGVISFAHALS